MTEFIEFDLNNYSKDKLLATIEYVDHPKSFEVPGSSWIGGGIDVSEPIVNYSQLYLTLTNDIIETGKIPHPSTLRNGDIVAFDPGYRGVGTYYCLWLRNSNIELSTIENKSLHNETSDTQKTVNKIEKKDNFPTFFSRESKGSHNDNKHECYLFQHSDEMGYAASTAVSSMNDNYFKREYLSIFIDPILTHTQSFYGKLISECKQQEKWINNPNFPDNYVGYCDRFYDEEPGIYESSNIEWTPLFKKESNDESNDQLIDESNEDGFYDEYFCPKVIDIRNIFIKHFELLISDDLTHDYTK